MAEVPTVSVLMTAYNREQYIGEAIESVLASTFKDFELIIVDDCSTDCTVEIAKKYAAVDNRIRLFVNEQNLGDYPNRNRAASYAKGEYLKYVDSDDKIFRDGLEKCVSIMERFPDSGFGIFYKQKDHESEIIPSGIAIKQHFFQSPFLFIGPGGTILRRIFFESIGKYPIDYGPANDMYFNLKAASKTNVVLLPFDFLYYRIHQGQEFNNKYSYLYNNYKYLDTAFKKLPLGLKEKEVKWLSKKNKRRFIVNLTKYFFRTRNLNSTVKAVKLAGFTFKDALIGIFHFD